MVDMIGSGSKGVGIRLYAEGGELVRKTFDQIADSGKKMWAELGAGTKQANPALKGLSAVVEDVKGGIDGLVDRAGSLGRGLSAAGVAGVAFAAAIGGAAVALMRAREAMQWAAQLTDQAEALGVTTENLQMLRYAADEFGSSGAAMDATLAGLSKALGAVKTGLGDGKVLAAFAALGFTREQIQSFHSIEAALPEVADRVKEMNLSFEETRKIASALGIDESLVPALRRGGQAIREAGEDGKRLGAIMEGDVVSGLNAANRAMDRSQQIIDTQLRTAFAALGDDAAWAAEKGATALAWLAQQADRVGRQMNRYFATSRPTGSFIDMFRMGARERLEAEKAGVRVDGDLLGGLDAWDASRRSSRPPSSSQPSGGSRSSRGGGSAARPSGITAERYDKLEIVTAEEIERMQLAIQLETARIAKNVELVRALERELELRELIDRYTKTGLSEDDARLSAELEQSRRDAARFADMSDYKANRADELRASVEALDETRQARIDDIRQVWRQGVRAAFSGDLEEFLANVLMEAFGRGVDSIADDLFDMVFGAFDQGGAFGSGGSGGGFDWLGALKSVFSSWGGSGGFTPTSEAEFFGTGGGPAGAAKIVQVSVSLDGARGDDDIRRIAAEGVQQGVQASIELTRRHGEEWRVDAYQMNG